MGRVGEEYATMCAVNEMDAKQLLELLKGKLEPGDYEKATAYLTDVGLKAKETETELKTVKAKLGEYEGKVKEQELDKHLEEQGVDEQFRDLIKDKLINLTPEQRSAKLEEYRQKTPAMFSGEGSPNAGYAAQERQEAPSGAPKPLPPGEKTADTNPPIKGIFKTSKGIVYA